VTWGLAVVGVGIGPTTSRFSGGLAPLTGSDHCHPVGVKGQVAQRLYSNSLSEHVAIVSIAALLQKYPYHDQARIEWLRDLSPSSSGADTLTPLA
jgi:hypothetical protein